MKKTILLTGATGFLGSHLLEALLNNNYQVVILKRSFSDTWRIAHLMDQVKSYDLDKEPLEKAFQDQRIDLVIHTACNYGRNNESVTRIMETNLMFGLRLLEAGKLFDIKAFINTDTFFNKPGHDLDYMGEYVLSKRQFVEWIFHSRYSFKSINVKPEHIYGPKDSASKFFPWLIGQFRKKAPEIKLTNCTHYRDFIHVDDVVSAYVAILDNINTIDDYEEFSVGTGHETQVRQFVEKAKQLYEEIHGPIPTILKFGVVTTRGNEIMRSLADINELKKIGWLPKIAIKDGIQTTIKEFVEE